MEREKQTSENRSKIWDSSQIKVFIDVIVSKHEHAVLSFSNLWMAPKKLAYRNWSMSDKTAVPKKSHFRSLLFQILFKMWRFCLQNLIQVQFGGLLLDLYL